MYSGKIAVPPGGGGIVYNLLTKRNTKLIFLPSVLAEKRSETLFESS
jgi:hypothetical protein